MKKGKVFLVGAGPGDIKLISVRGMELLQQADSIVYDGLVNEGLLRYKGFKTSLIYVGKSPGHHTMSQDGINRVLVEEALKGSVVVRLKGGDPFLFGRGGEEAEALRKAGISFEVVPGITSALAVPAYAGIPVTQRGVSSTMTIITGHEDPLKDESQIDWQRLASDPGTLVFLMGVKNLPHIVEQLIGKGMTGERPVALIQWGTRTMQRVVGGNLYNIVEKVEKAGMGAPAVIVVGEVVNLRDTLQWYEERPLFGKRVLVTRSREQAGILSRKIEELGGEALEIPAISIEPPADYSLLDRSLRQAADYDWIIFTSINGVDGFFKRLKDLDMDIRCLGKARLGAIGPVTREALERRGLRVEYVPDHYYAEALAEGIKEKMIQGEKVLIPRAQKARPALVDMLCQFGMDVTEVPAYQTVITDPPVNPRKHLEKGEVDLITFTSSSTVSNFLSLLGDKPLEVIPGDIRIVCIGSITAETALSHGLPVHAVAEEYTIDGLVEALIKIAKE